MQEAHGIGFVHERWRVFRYKGTELVAQLFARDVVRLLYHVHTRCGGDVVKCGDNDQSQRAVLGPRKPLLLVRVRIRIRVRVRVRARARARARVRVSAEERKESNDKEDR
jgi:hypothetical protein